MPFADASPHPRRYQRPEHRDALLVLRELRDGIERLEAEAKRLASRAHHEKWNKGPDEDEDDEDNRGFGNFNVFDR